MGLIKPVIISPKALQDLDETYAWILYKFGKPTLENFHKKWGILLKLLSTQPTLFPYLVSARKPLNPLSFLFFRIKINHEQSIIIINFIEFRYNYCYLFGIKNNPFA